MKTDGSLGFDEIGFDTAEVFRYMGSPAAIIPGEIKGWVDRLVAETALISRPRYCWRLYPLDESAPHYVVVRGKRLNTGKIISQFFSTAELCLAYVATSGREFEAWAKAYPFCDELTGQFIADSIGSELVEATARKMLADISAELAAKGLKTGIPYSPGYCGWSVAEQQELFSLLPLSPAGVHLSSSSLMSPVKSVSGIVPVGRNVEKTAYGCQICSRPDCYKRKSK